MDWYKNKDISKLTEGRKEYKQLKFGRLHG